MKLHQQEVRDQRRELLADARGDVAFAHIRAGELLECEEDIR
jgi:hypothetical protein